MNRTWLWAFAAIAAFTTACGGDPEIVLPTEYTIENGGNLYQATADLCGTVAVDEAGRGRWRRWTESDSRIASARVRNDPDWGTIVLIQPGTYTVPQDLCEDERVWLNWLLGIGFVVAAVLIVFRMGRDRPPKEPRSLEEAAYLSGP